MEEQNGAITDGTALVMKLDFWDHQWQGKSGHGDKNGRLLWVFLLSRVTKVTKGRTALSIMLLERSYQRYDERNA